VRRAITESAQVAADADADALQSAGVDDQRWGFEEADDWEYEQPSGKPPPDRVEEPAESLIGEDSDGVVAVVVSPEAEVVGVRLSPEWRSAVDPRELHSKVLLAANTATMRALACNVERMDSTAAAEPAEPRADADQSALTTQDVQRLLYAVSAELDQFTERLSAVVGHPVQVQSAGGHVQGSAQQGQVLQLDIDPVWAGQARHTEIENELVEVLRGLNGSTTPRALGAGPSGNAISELMDLAADPQRLMRRLGLPG
jgi:hypothetical protein